MTQGRPGTAVECRRPVALWGSHFRSSYRHIKIFLFIWSHFKNSHFCQLFIINGSPCKGVDWLILFINWHLLCARYYAWCWDYSTEQDTHGPCPLGGSSLREEIENKWNNSKCNSHWGKLGMMEKNKLTVMEWWWGDRTLQQSWEMRRCWSHGDRDGGHSSQAERMKRTLRVNLDLI